MTTTSQYGGSLGARSRSVSAIDRAKSPCAAESFRRRLPIGALPPSRRYRVFLPISDTKWNDLQMRFTVIICCESDGTRRFELGSKAPDKVDVGGLESLIAHLL